MAQRIRILFFVPQSFYGRKFGTPIISILSSYSVITEEVDMVLNAVESVVVLFFVQGFGSLCLLQLTTIIINPMNRILANLESNVFDMGLGFKVIVNYMFINLGCPVIAYISEFGSTTFY